MFKQVLKIGLGLSLVASSLLAAPEKTKLKIGLASSKEVYQYSLDNDFIRKFESCSEVERILNINKSSVASCCRFKRKSTGGYKWYYEKQNN